MSQSTIRNHPSDTAICPTFTKANSTSSAAVRTRPKLPPATPPTIRPPFIRTAWKGNDNLALMTGNQKSQHSRSRQSGNWPRPSSLLLPMSSSACSHSAHTASFLTRNACTYLEVAHKREKPVHTFTDWTLIHFNGPNLNRKVVYPKHESRLLCPSIPRTRKITWCFMAVQTTKTLKYFPTSTCTKSKQSSGFNVTTWAQILSSHAWPLESVSTITKSTFSVDTTWTRTTKKDTSMICTRYAICNYV